MLGGLDNRRYRVSQKNRSHVLKCCNSYKRGTRNKKRVNFEKVMKLSFQNAKVQTEIWNGAGNLTWISIGTGNGTRTWNWTGNGNGSRNYLAKINFFQKFQAQVQMGHFKPDLLLKFFWFDPPFKSYHQKKCLPGPTQLLFFSWVTYTMKKSNFFFWLCSLCPRFQRPHH